MNATGNPRLQGREEVNPTAATQLGGGGEPWARDYDKLDVEAAYLARQATVCRLPVVYGERDYQRREEPILRRVRAGRSRVPVGAGSWLFTRGYVRDVAAGVRLALESEATIAEVLNLGESRTWTMGLWARHVLEAAGATTELTRVPDVLLPDDLQALGTTPQHLLVDSSKARDLLGWTETDPHQALARSVAWHLANPPPDAPDDFAADDRALAGAA
jgi:nucleoside-diphosphate-sugar epimerase